MELWFNDFQNSTSLLVILKITPGGDHAWPAWMSPIGHSSQQSQSIETGWTPPTLVQIMAPGHHPNQHWLIISKDRWKSHGGNFHKKYLNHQSLKMTLKITNPKFHSTLPGANESIINACTTFICWYLRWKKKSMVFNYDLISSLKLSYIQWWSNSFWKTQCFQHWQHGLADYSIFFSPLCWSYFFLYLCLLDWWKASCDPPSSQWLIFPTMWGDPCHMRH